MPNDYIPGPDSAFGAWAQNFWSTADGMVPGQPFDPGQLAAVETALNNWNAAFAASNTARAAAESATTVKNQAREALAAAIRPFAAAIQAMPSITDKDRALLGLRVRDPNRTTPTAPATRPLVRVEAGLRLQHNLKFADEATPSRRAKPQGTMGAEVWLAVSPTGQPAPAPGGAYRFMGLNSRGAMQAEFTSADAGKTANYVLRWVSTRGEPGPWSEVASATVAA